MDELEDMEIDANQLCAELVLSCINSVDCSQREIDSIEYFAHNTEEIGLIMGCPFSSKNYDDISEKLLSLLSPLRRKNKIFVREYACKTGSPERRLRGMGYSVREIADYSNINLHDIRKIIRLVD